MPSAFNPQTTEYGKNELIDFINKKIVNVDKKFYDKTALTSIKNNISDFYANINLTTEVKDSSYYMKQYTTVCNFLIKIKKKTNCFIFL